MSMVELVLGTVQFGLNYGIAGRGEIVPQSEVREILDKAWNLGIRRLDTAPVYGNIEKTLKSLTSDLPFHIASKIPALPPNLSVNKMRDWVRTSIYKSQDNLGPLLSTLFFHRCDDLLEKNGELIWSTANQALLDTNIQLGVSCYSPSEVSILRQKFLMEVIQLPGNAFDQRIRTIEDNSNLVIYLRSVFLQGALLLTQQEVESKFTQGQAAMMSWREWCRERILSPLQAALGIVKGLPNVRYCIIGVNNVSQLEEIVQEWTSVDPLFASDLAVHNNDVIDPRCWH